MGAVQPPGNPSTDTGESQFTVAQQSAGAADLTTDAPQAPTAGKNINGTNLARQLSSMVAGTSEDEKSSRISGETAQINDLPTLASESATGQGNSAANESANQNATAAVAAQGSARNSASGDQIQQSGTDLPKPGQAAANLTDSTSPQTQNNPAQDSAHRMVTALRGVESFLPLPTTADQVTSSTIPVMSHASVNAVASQNSVPAATQSTISVQGPVAARSPDLPANSNGASSDSGTGGSGSPKNSNGINSSNDGKEGQTVSAQPPSHSITGDQAVQQGTNGIRPSLDGSRLADATSQQMPGIVLQGMAHAVGTTANRSDAALRSSPQDGQPAPAPTSETAPLSAVDSASLIQKMNQTEMQVAVHSVEFGAISIRTALSQEQMTTQITVDHGGLGSALAAHVSSLESKLGNDLGLRTLVQVSHSAMSFSGERGHSSQGSQKGFQPAAGPPDLALSPVESDDRGLRLAALTNSGDRLDVRA